MIDFNFVKLVFTVRLASDLSDPFILFFSREGFAESFRRATGCSCVDCTVCIRRDECPYPLVFSQQLSHDPAGVKRHQKPALPFVFDFPVLPPSPNRGALVEIGLALAGSAARHADSFIAALELFLGPSSPGCVRGSIEKVESKGYFSEGSVVKVGEGGTSPDSLIVLSAAGLCDTRTLADSTTRLVMETPMKIMHEGRVLAGFDFSLFARSVLRRVSSLAYYYCSSEVSADFRWLADRSANISVSEHSFRWEEWKGAKGGGKLSGMVGKGTLTGDLTELLPYLLVGEYFHVGKGASFGLGRFRIQRP